MAEWGEHRAHARSTLGETRPIHDTKLDRIDLGYYPWPTPCIWYNL